MPLVIVFLLSLLECIMSLHSHVSGSKGFTDGHEKILNRGSCPMQQAAGRRQEALTGLLKCPTSEDWGTLGTRIPF